MHRINHPFASEPSGGISLLLFLSASEKLSECGRYSTAAVVAVSREKENGSREDSHTRSVRWPAPLRASALKEQISLKEYTGDRVFLKMSYHPCVSGCGRSLAPQDGHDHCLTCLGIQHAEEAFVDGSCSSCGDMTISELHNRLRCVKHGGVPLPLPRSGVRPGTKRGGTASGGVRGDLRITVRASPSGVSHPSGTPQPAGVPLVRTGASAEWGTPPVSFGASPDDQMSVAASEGEPSLSGDDDSAALPPSGVVALSEPDPEMTAMLSRAAENVGLVWNPPPRPDPSRLDEWFLGGGRARFQRPPPVPFFPEVHEELTRSWKAPFTARNKPCGSSPLTTLDGGAALGYTGIPSVERSVAMQLCPTVASTPRGEPCLPSRACKYSSGLTGSAYRACGEAASALHAMALLQVHQAKALRDLHEGGHDLAVLHELRAATDLTLRATKVTAQSLGRAMSTLVVQERHLWLCLTDMKEQEKVQFLNAPVSQTGLFGDAVESCAQQFSAAQKQTEAIKHIMRRRKPAAASTPAIAPQPARRRGAPLWPSPLPRRGSSLPPCGVVEPVTDRTPSPSRPPPDPVASASARGPETGDPEMEGTARREMVTAPLPPPEEGRVEDPLFRFVFVPPLAQQPAVPKTSIKEQFPQSLGLKRRRVVYRASRDHFPPPLSPGRGGLPKSTPPAHLWNRVRAVALKPPLQVVTRKPGSSVSSHTRRNQVSVTLHTQTPPPAITGQAFTGPGPGPCVPHRCPTTGTSVADRANPVESSSTPVPRRGGTYGARPFSQ